MTDTPRLAIIASHPIQYQVPLFRALASNGTIDPHVLFLSRHGVEERLDPDFGATFRWDIELLDGYQHSFVPSLVPDAVPGHIASYVNPGVIRVLSTIQPHVILFLGVRGMTQAAALLWARRRAIPCLYRAESSVLATRSRVSKMLARFVLRHIDGVLPIGTANDLYYAALGYPESRRFLAPYTVDNGFFSRALESVSDARGALRLDDHGAVVLYVGKLVSRKGIETLVDACAQIRQPMQIVLAGDGPARSEIEARAADRGVQMTVLGFLNQTALSRSYSAADVLVLPSLEEPWGLVVNEAMASGLPVIASSRVGARLDLVHPGVTGEVFPAGDVDALRQALDRLLQSDSDRTEMGRNAARLIARWGIADTAAGVERAVLALA